MFTPTDFENVSVRIHEISFYQTSAPIKPNPHHVQVLDGVSKIAFDYGSKQRFGAWKICPRQTSSNSENYKATKDNRS